MVEVHVCREREEGHHERTALQNYSGQMTTLYILINAGQGREGVDGNVTGPARTRVAGGIAGGCGQGELYKV